MGRIFETRKHVMFARWDRMAKAFARIGKEIAIAVKAGGTSADSNPALRRAIQNARAANMPKDKVDNAIKKASGAGAESYDELVYEGYAPHGVAIVVETATNNPTRTIANVRMHLNKGNGKIAASGSVLYNFKRMGVIHLSPEGVDPEELELELIDHALQELGASTNDKGEPILVLRCDFQDFGTLQAAVEAKGLHPLSSQSEYVAENTVTLDEEQATEVLQLVDRLEQDDDVQRVFHNLV